MKIRFLLDENLPPKLKLAVLRLNPEAHWTAGGHIWGVIWLRPGTTLASWAEAIFLIWEATDREEWIDRLDWIPF